MFTPDLMLSIFTGLAVGLLAIGLNLPRLVPLLGCSAGLAVEAYVSIGQGQHAFGTNLVNHLLVNIVLASAVHLVLKAIAGVYSRAANYEADPATSSQVEGRWTAVVAHGAGLLNVWPFVGLFAQAVVWGFTRGGSDKERGQVVEALQFQASYLMLLAVLTPMLRTVVAGYSLLIFAAWFVLTIIGLMQAWRKGTFRYPLNFRFIEYYGQARHAIQARRKP